MKIVKEYHIPMCHRLTNHDGLCKHLHGHTYKLVVGLDGPIQQRQGSSEGMVADFKDLNGVIDKFIMEPYDHCILLWSGGDEFDKELIASTSNALKKVIMDERTTVENIARKMYVELKQAVIPFEIWRFELWETPTAYAYIGGVEDV
jgi:6-pyruvoyltetrahydropterin/6-carboxytetrahydropterin synthase